MTTWLRPPVVLEHENAHYWPDGEYDGPEDEDCAFCAGLMQYLALHPGGAAATLYEAELIRHAAGLHPSGPASSDDVIRGLEAKFGWSPTKVTGFAALWAALAPGHSAAVSGHPSDAPTGSPFRHWLPNFTGGHKEFVGRYDSSDRVWLMDPEGPADGRYRGEWVGKADLEAYVKNATSAHTVAPMRVVTVGKTLACGAKLRPDVHFGAAFGTVATAARLEVLPAAVTGSTWKKTSSCNPNVANTGTRWYAVKSINGKSVSALHPGHSTAYVYAGAVAGG